MDLCINLDFYVEDRVQYDNIEQNLFDELVLQPASLSQE